MAEKKIIDSDLGKTDKIFIPKDKVKKQPAEREAPPDELGVLSEMESGLSAIEHDYPTLAEQSSLLESRTANLKAILDISQAINSSLVLDDILQKVMKHAIVLLQAERGFLMLLDESGELQFKTIHNISQSRLLEDSFKISFSIANRVARTGMSVFTSDAQADERYAKQKSIAELNLRSIMCVPLKIKEKIIGVVYLDNSSEAKVFLESDLYLFELFAEQAAIAIENAKLYENLLKLKKYNESVVNKSPVGIIVLNENYIITTFNDAASDILISPPKKALFASSKPGLTGFYEILAENQRPYWERNLNQVRENGGVFEDSRYYYRADEEEKVLSIKISPLETEPQNHKSLIIVIEDVTEKVILENYVMLSEKLVAKGEMAASIGHELNNYLAIISSSAELLVKNLDLKRYDKLEMNAGEIVEKIAKIKRFTDGLMDFSKLEKEVVLYDLRKLVDDLLFSIRPQRNFAEIKFEIDIAPDLPQIEIDVGQIQQVLINCLYNSMEALQTLPGHQGIIRISAALNEKDRNQVVLEVTDNGPGIEKNPERVFEPGFTTKTKGHGLGLANCQRIIESHLGEMSFASTPGQKTTFTIILPVNQTTTSTQ